MAFIDMLTPDDWTSPFRIVLSLLALAAFLAASAHAVVRRRDHRAAAWWITISFFMPLVGPALYFMFGVNYIKRRIERRRKRRAKAGARPGPDAHPYAASSQKLPGLSRLVGQVVGLPLLNGHAVTAYDNGDQAYPAMIKAIDGAERSVALSTFIFARDKAGNQFIDALGRAVSRGIEVRVLVDDVGSGLGWFYLEKAFKAKSIPIAYFMPALVPWRTMYLNLRNHRKILTVDGKTAFTGGMNIHEGHILSVTPRKETKTQDMHFRLDGPVAAQIQDVFREDWYFTTGERLDGDAWFPPIEAAGKTLARVIPDGPDQNHQNFRWTVLSALSHAAKSVRVVSPYFLPDASLISQLGLAAMSGVEVDIVLPDVIDLRMVRWASQSLMWQLLERGCRIWLAPPPFQHTKLVIVDRAWSLIGSSNWDNRSMRLNFEMNVECYDETLAGQLDDRVKRMKEEGRQLTLAEVDARPFRIRLRDGVARLFTPIL